MDIFIANCIEDLLENMSSSVIEMQCGSVCVSNRQYVCRSGCLGDIKMEPNHLEPHSEVDNLSFFENDTTVVK